MNKDVKGYSFSYDAYRKIKPDNRTRMSALLRPTQLPSRLSLSTVSSDTLTGRPGSGDRCYTTILIITVNLPKLTIIIPACSTFSTVSAPDSYINRHCQFQVNQEMVKRTNLLRKVHYINRSLKSLHSTSRSKEIHPAVPTSEELNVLQHYEHYLLAVNRATRVQQGVRNGQVHVSRLRSTRLGGPDSLKAEVRNLTDDRYLSVRLNGIEECQTQCYWKESFPYFVVHEISSLKRDQHAAPKIIIDITTNALPNCRNTYNNNTLTKLRGNLNLPDSMVSLNLVRSPKEAPKENKSASNFNPRRRPCPGGDYLNPIKKRHAQLYWINNSSQPKTMDIGMEIPFSRTRELPFPNRLYHSALDNNEKADVLAKSATSNPAALTSESEPAATSMICSPETSIIKSVPDYIELLTITNDRDKPVEEVSSDKEGAIDEPMNDPDNANPLEFTSTYLILYETSASKEFVAVQTAIVAEVNGLQLAMKRTAFSVSSERNQGFWFGMESANRVWQTRVYLLHCTENERSTHL